MFYLLYFLPINKNNNHKQCWQVTILILKFTLVKMLSQKLGTSLVVLDDGKDWRQEEKGMTEDEMARWHHRLNGREFKQTLGHKRTGKPGKVQPKGLKSVGHNLVTEELQLVVQWLRLRPPTQGLWVWSPVREPRSHMPRDPKNQMIKQKQYSNKFNKDVKNGSIKKKSL